MALAREAPAEAPEEPMDAVEPAGVGEEHERALPVHDLDPPLAAESDRLGDDRPLPRPAVHPDARHAGLGAVAGRLQGGRGRRHEEGPLDRGRDLGVINIANSAPQVLAPVIAAPIVTGVAGYTGLYLITAVITLLSAVLVTRIRSVP
jgi:hypothetical protein